MAGKIDVMIKGEAKKKREDETDDMNDMKHLRTGRINEIEGMKFFSEVQATKIVTYAVTEK